jgi:mRNA-degrading endonuclease toxin of MazEF toxin-antitoxin module
MKRGDFATVAMQGNFGKPRPVLIFQFDRFDEQATVTILPVTSTLVDAPLFGSIRTIATFEFTGRCATLSRSVPCVE